MINENQNFIDEMLTGNPYSSNPSVYLQITVPREIRAALAVPVGRGAGGLSKAYRVCFEFGYIV